MELEKELYKIFFNNYESICDIDSNLFEKINIERAWSISHQVLVAFLYFRIITSMLPHKPSIVIDMKSVYTERKQIAIGIQIMWIKKMKKEEENIRRKQKNLSR